MFHTLAYYNTVLHRAFTAYTAERLGQVGLPFGLLFPVIYVGKHPGCTQAELTKALGLDWGYSQRCVVKLTEESFLRREKQGRAYHLSLLPRGEEAFALGHQVFFRLGPAGPGGAHRGRTNPAFALANQNSRARPVG